MKKPELRQLIKEEIQKIITEQGPDKYVGKYKGKLNMYRDDEGNIYIKDKKINWVSIGIEDSEGNKRNEDDIKQDIKNSVYKQSEKDFKKQMRGY